MVMGREQDLVAVVRAISGLVGHLANTSITGRAVARDADSQRQQVMQVSALTEEMTASIDEVARNADALREHADAMMARSTDGRRTVESAVANAKASAQGVEEVRRLVQSLDAKVRAISDVVGMIGEIARQTNLLALNAAIEAARAGQQGRAFGVVAEEVQKLADRTHRATKEVAAQIERIQGDSVSVVEQIQHMADAVREGTEHIEQSGEAFKSLVAMVSESTRIVHGVAQATRQQAAAMTDLARAAERMAAAAVSTDEAAGHLSREVVEAARLAGQAREGMLKLNLELGDGDLLELAKADHLLWKQRVYAMLLGAERIDPAGVGSHRECRLGRWYYGRGRERFGGRTAFDELEKPHEALHQLARRAAEAMEQGDRPKAEEAYQELERCSSEILALLNELQVEAERAG